LAAAGLKYHFGLTSPGPVVGLAPSDAVAVALIGTELFFGFWAVTGVYPRTLRRAGCGLFAIFFLASLVSAAEGNRTCGCFGRVTIPPLAVAAFDALMALALWYSPPPPRPSEWAAGRQPTLMAVLFVGAAAAVIPLALHRGVFESRALVFDAERLDFGLVEVGGRAELTVSVTNATARPAGITSFHTSCPCLDVRPRGIDVPPRGTRELVFVYDSTKQPGASGRYRISFAGRDAAGDVVCAGHVVVELVRNRD
jgi:hypothetical protein